VILLSLALLGIGIADLLRWSPEPVSTIRALLATAGATAATAGLAALSGLPALDVVLLGVITAVVLTVWTFSDQSKFKQYGPGYPLLLILTVLVGALAMTGSFDAATGPLADWYSNLAFPFVKSVTLDQFLLAVGAGIFLLATANRVVRLVLDAAGTPAVVGESALRGGRVLGPLERLFVFGMVLSGDLTAAAVVIAAKGLLRLPEIRDSASQSEGASDHVTEYFLIGTFMSWLVATGLAVLILGAG
jgi:uncharacterized membrane protein YqjE